MGKNAIVGQSGGPTSVINASLAGVYESCKNRGAGIGGGAYGTSDNITVKDNAQVTAEGNMD